jgi:hypothetical protein
MGGSAISFWQLPHFGRRLTTLRLGSELRAFEMPMAACSRSQPSGLVEAQGAAVRDPQPQGTDRSR